VGILEIDVKITVRRQIKYTNTQEHATYSWSIRKIDLKSSEK